jgi:hypothetical protein
MGNMILLLIIPCWILLLALVLGLCLAARRGDQRVESGTEAGAHGAVDEPSLAYGKARERGNADSAQQLVGASGTLA